MNHFTLFCHFIISQNNLLKLLKYYKIISQMQFASTVKIFILLALAVSYVESKPSLKCLAYLLQLKSYYQTNKGLFMKQMAPYLLFSGKQLDDMGFPKLCVDNNMGYTTVKVDSYVTDQHITQHSDFLFSFYYGFCFTNVCSVKDLNEGGKFIVENIFEDTPLNISSVAFYDTSLEAQYSAVSIIFMIIFSVWILLGFVGLLSKWFSQCRQQQQIAIQISIPLQQADKKPQQPQQQKYEQPIQSGFFKNISIGRKWMTLWTPQNTTKIPQFSTFKIISIPLILYGYYFYLCNQGSFNIFAFNSQIYDSFYSQVATFTYYIPDLFFFISGFLLTKNVFTQVQYAGNKNMLLVKKLIKKLIRLYPIYIACLVIFWGIVPSLHSGPVWEIYKQNQITICQTVWWRNLLMIDNFFTDGCFNFSWWVQVQVQYTLLALFTFFLLFINKSIGTIWLYIQLLASWILLFVLSQRLPVQLQVTVNKASQHYFKSFHSHLPFYLTGVTFALLFKKQSIKRLVINYYFKNFLVFVFGVSSCIAVLFVIIFRPVTFSYASLDIQLALCRMGVLYSFIIYCLPGFIKQRNQKTIKHKIAELSYPIILVSGIIVGASFWGLQTFPYTSGPSLLYSLIPNLILSVIVGNVLHLLFNFIKPKGQKPQAI